MNKLTKISCIAALCCSAALPAQDADLPPNMSIPEAAVTARLEPSTFVVTEGGKFEVTLVARFKAPITIPQTLLAGHYFVVHVGDKQFSSISQPVEGQARIAAGAVLQRTVEIDFTKAYADKYDELPPNSRVTLSWSGVPGATTTVQLVPDQSQLDVASLDLEKTRVRLITNYGEMVVKLRPDKAPNHAENFVKLAKDGFYNGTQFHRVMKNFMIQGGCPNTKKGATGSPGSGNPGYTIDSEFNDLKHVRGTLSMARSPDPDSAGCQFFVMHGEAPALDGQYTAFGMLQSGFETLDKIVDVRVQRTPRGEPSEPVEPVHLYAAVVMPVTKENP